MNPKTRFSQHTNCQVVATTVTKKNPGPKPLHHDSAVIYHPISAIPCKFANKIGKASIYAFQNGHFIEMEKSIDYPQKKSEHVLFKSLL